MNASAPIDVTSLRTSLTSIYRVIFLGLANAMNARYVRCSPGRPEARSRLSRSENQITAAHSRSRIATSRHTVLQTRIRNQHARQFVRDQRQRRRTAAYQAHVAPAKSLADRNSDQR